ncbi:MAG TPA: NifU family protein [Methylocystis sp.]|nr:NifU family protein [Methylocystis sp.]
MLRQVEETMAPTLDREQIIRSVIDEVRPNLRRDGGDCELIEVCGNKVMVRLTGACVFCKLSSATLEGIQAKLVERLGEFVRLIPVAGAPTKLAGAPAQH